MSGLLLHSWSKHTINKYPLGISSIASSLAYVCSKLNRGGHEKKIFTSYSWTLGWVMFTLFFWDFLLNNFLQKTRSVSTANWMRRSSIRLWVWFQRDVRKSVQHTGIILVMHADSYQSLLWSLSSTPESSSPASVSDSAGDFTIASGSTRVIWFDRF